MQAIGIHLTDESWLQKFTELYDGWHAAIYVSNFSGAFRAMEAADLIFTEHGFFDANISGLRDAQKFHQFRFQASSRVLAALTHDLGCTAAEEVLQLSCLASTASSSRHANAGFDGAQNYQQP